MSIKIVYPVSTTWLDYPDDCSNSILVFCTGCDHNCRGCHSKDLQDFNYANDNIKKFEVFEFVKLINILCKKHNTDKLVLSGGDFLHPDNISFTKKILKELFHVNVCIYTGYNIQYCKDNCLTGFSFLKSGCYMSEFKVESEKTDEYMQFASLNQNLYDSNYNLISKEGRYYFK